MLQIKRRVRRLGRTGQRGQQLLGRCQRQLGVNRVVFAFRLVRFDADARRLGQKDQFVSLQLGGHAGSHFFHGQIKGFAGG